MLGHERTQARLCVTMLPEDILMPAWKRGLGACRSVEPVRCTTRYVRRLRKRTDGIDLACSTNAAHLTAAVRCMHSAMTLPGYGGSWRKRGRCDWLKSATLAQNAVWRRRCRSGLSVTDPPTIEQASHRRASTSYCVHLLNLIYPPWSDPPRSRRCDLSGLCPCSPP